MICDVCVGSPTFTTAQVNVQRESRVGEKDGDELGGSSSRAERLCGVNTARRHLRTLIFFPAKLVISGWYQNESLPAPVGVSVTDRPLVDIFLSTNHRVLSLITFTILCLETSSVSYVNHCDAKYVHNVGAASNPDTLECYKNLYQLAG